MSSILDMNEALEKIVGSTKLITDEKELFEAARNRIGINRKLASIVFPQSQKDVKSIVDLANHYRIPLFPVSGGKNFGYGGITPTIDDAVVVHLRDMNDISNYDPSQGKVVIESGVTQGQLADFCESTSHRPDVTGAPLTATYLGNTVAGGFGHTPLGNHRNTISNLEIVLGNGEIVKTGDRIREGPDITGLYLQSNFGIVTSAEIDLMPVPESFASYALDIEDDNLEKTIDILSKLRQDGTITSCVHVGNAVRLMMTTGSPPEGFEDKILTNADARKYASTRLHKAGDFTATGGLYGTEREVWAKKKALRKALGDVGKLQFFTDSKLSFARSSMQFFSRFRLTDWLFDATKTTGQLGGLTMIHNLMQGVPSDMSSKRMGYWRVDDLDDAGFMWYAPVLEAKGSEVRRVINIAEKLYHGHGYEFPATFTLVEPTTIVCITNTNFNRNDPSSVSKVHDFYEKLDVAMNGEGVVCYRRGINGMQHVKYPQGKKTLIEGIKKLSDPNNIIAPGLYNI